MRKNNYHKKNKFVTWGYLTKKAASRKNRQKWKKETTAEIDESNLLKQKNI